MRIVVMWESVMAFSFLQSRQEVFCNPCAWRLRPPGARRAARAVQLLLQCSGSHHQEVEMQQDTKPEQAGPRDEHEAHEAHETQRDTRTASQKEEAERTDPRRTSQRPKQTAEVPLGTGGHPEPPGGGGRQSQPVSPDKRDKH
jgi:hypothetical protein